MRALHKTRLAACVLVLSACASCERAQGATGGARKSRPADASDARVIKDLTAADRRKAARAVHEVLARGGRMIPHLLRLKGDRRCFFGDWELGTHVGGSFRFTPLKRDQCYEESSASTVEVAALFLIESVYRNDLKFAQGATLAEWKTGGEERMDVEKNGRELLERAWVVTERWSKEFEREGLESLRAKDRGPFAGTRLGFY
jgi:hypothetical protein